MTIITTVYTVHDRAGDIVDVTGDPDVAQAASLDGQIVHAETTEVPMT